MIWKSVLFRPNNLYEALFRQKLLGLGSETVVGTDYTPYIYRSAPSFGAPYNRQRPVVVGGSVGWNQLCNVATASKTENGITWTKVENNRWTASGTATADFSARVIYFIREANHVYYYKACPQGGSASTYYVGATASDTGNGILVKSSTTSGVALTANIKSGTTVNDLHFDAFVIDLTALWGSTVADAIYAMEQATAGSGAAYFKSLFGDGYFSYNSGSLESVQTSGHVIRDANDTVIGNYALDSDLVLRGIPRWVDGGLRYDGDIYYPNGTVERRYAEVDLGSLTWNYNSDWGGAGAFFPTNAPSGIKIPTDASLLTNCMCSAYVQMSRNDLYDTPTAKAFCIPTQTGKISIRDSAYTTTAAFEQHLADIGAKLVYELATPTTESADPYTALQMADPQGTEEWVTSGIVPVGQETEYIQK